MTLTEEYLAFEKQSPSPAHAFLRVQKILDKGKYARVKDGQWPKKKGYALLGNSIVAYNVKGNRPGVVFLGRPNKPSLIVKAEGETRDGVYNFVKVRRCDSAYPTTWGARDLRLAGFTMNGTLYDSQSAVAFIPRESDAFYHEMPLSAESMFMPLLGIDTSLKDVVGEDPVGLFFTDASPAHVVGADSQFLCGSGVADLAGVLCAAKAFAKCEPKDGTSNFLVIYDAVGCFNLQGVLEDFASHVFSGSFNDALCVNFGLVPGFHPNYPELTDEENAPVLGGGIGMIDGSELTTRVIVERTAGKLGIPVQKFMEKTGNKTKWSNTPPSCVAPMGMRYVYVGVPTLGLSAAKQTVAIRDLDSLARFAEEIAANSDLRV